MTAQQWFEGFWAEVRKTEQWAEMEATVEASEWHREANVAVHTTMCIDHYIANTAAQRSQRQQMLTLVTLLFHDFGKPEAEETLERKDGSGTTYHRYAGHEPKSANEFISFLMAHEELAKDFFAQGFSWTDVRKIKWMIEHHLPYGLKNPTKRMDLKAAMIETMGDDLECFFDQLWSDCNGRISDNHDEKRASVLAWIAEFRLQAPAKFKIAGKNSPDMFVLQGPVGVGKSTWINRNVADCVVVSEDNYRMDFYWLNLANNDKSPYMAMSSKDRYRVAWQYCFDHDKDYSKYAREQLAAAIATGKTLVLDRTNQTRKSRRPWITAAMAAGYRITTVEFYCTESLSQARQKTRLDKDVPPNRAHMIYMAMEVPWLGVETEDFVTVPIFD